MVIVKLLVSLNLLQRSAVKEVGTQEKCAKEKASRARGVIGQTLGSLSVYLHYYCCDVCLPGQCLSSLELANSIVVSKLPMIVWH